MTENSSVLASAVIVPDADELTAKQIASAKRRHSSVSYEEAKRVRLSPSLDQMSKASGPVARPRPPVQERISRDPEEQKRGKRLFGVLLGALSQGSSSAVQRRRGDIERKQQEKLKLQTEEYDEQQKKQREDRLELRRQEQDRYLKQAALTRRSHKLAASHFLQTNAKPKLYYIPWDLLPNQKVLIDKQVREAEVASVHTQKEDEVSNKLRENPSEAMDETDDVATTEVSATSAIKALSSEHRTPDDKMPGKVPESLEQHSHQLSEDAGEDGNDDFVKGDEDDVLY